MCICALLNAPHHFYLVSPIFYSCFCMPSFSQWVPFFLLIFEITRFFSFSTVAAVATTVISLKKKNNKFIIISFFKLRKDGAHLELPLGIQTKILHPLSLRLVAVGERDGGSVFIFPFSLPSAALSPKAPAVLNW